MFVIGTSDGCSTEHGAGLGSSVGREQRVQRWLFGTVCVTVVVCTRTV